MASPFSDCDNVDYGGPAADTCDDVDYGHPADVYDDDTPEPGEITRRRHRKRKRADSDDEEGEQMRLLANSQERDRMQRINGALEALRKCLPPQFHVYHRRLSKIRTLRVAINYIAALSDLLQQDNVRRDAAYRRSLLHTPAVPTNPTLFTPGSGTGPFPPPVTSYYPYLGPMCGTPIADPADPRTSAYSTPHQTPPTHPFNPVKLDFFATPIPGAHVSPRTMIAGITETSNKGDNFNYQRTQFTPSMMSHMKMSPADTLISPFLGLRNSHELDLSVMSASSDTYREDQDESSTYLRHPGTLDDAWNDEICGADKPGAQRFQCVSRRKAVTTRRLTDLPVAASDRC